MITTILDENDNYWLQLCDVRFACFNTMNSFLNIWVYSNWKHHHHHISYIEPLLKSQYCQCCHCWDPNVAGFFFEIPMLPMLPMATCHCWDPNVAGLCWTRNVSAETGKSSAAKISTGFVLIDITHNQDHPQSMLPIIIKKIVKGCCNIIWNKLWNSEYPPIESEMSFPFTWNAKYCGG